MKFKFLFSILVTIFIFSALSVCASASVSELKVGDVIQSQSSLTTISNPDTTKYIVTSIRKYNLSDEITEYVVYTNNEAGTSQTKINIMVADTRDGKASLAAGYGNLNPSVEGWTMCQATDQVEIYEKATGENVVGCINSSWFDVNTGEPTGMLVMNGTVQRNSTAETYLAYFSDGSVNLFLAGTTLQQAEAQQSAQQGIQVTVTEAVDAFGAPLVWDGKCVMEDARGNYPRSLAGVTEDGVTVLCQIESGVSDSVGYDCEPMAALMIKLGCVKVLRLDEGGSSTFCSKRATDDSIVMRNTSVQGTERNISGSILVIDNSGLSEKNTQTACQQGDHDYIYNDITGVFTCSKCSFSSAVQGTSYKYSGWAKSSTSGNEYFFVGGKKMTNYSYLNAIPTYFSSEGIACSGSYTINGENCLFERGCFVKCTTADVILAGFCGLESNLYDVQFILYADGNFVLSGKGETGKYDSYNSAYPIVPWNETFFRDSVKKIKIEKGITRLNRGLFRSFKNLTSVEFEKGSQCESIGLQCFYYNSELSNLILPDGLKSIDAEAFGCRKYLKKIYIPASVTLIKDNSFINCDFEKLTIYGVKGSEAERYAVLHNISFIEGEICYNDGHIFTVSQNENIIINTCSVCHRSYFFGNVDGYNDINVSDARLALRIAVGLEPSYTVDSNGYIMANVDGDEKVTVADARLILRAAIHLDNPKEVWKVYN